MPHSGDSQLDALLIIAPAGAYTGRVKHGIDMIMAEHLKTLGNEAKPKTKVSVVLVAGQDWMADRNYKITFVDSITNYVLQAWKNRMKYDVECASTDVSFESTEIVTGWLFKQIISFFKKSTDSMVYIDLTAGPKEWQFAAINAVNLFAHVVLYNVKPTAHKAPTDYTPSEVDDPGDPMLETVATGEEAWAKWISRKDEKGKYNAHFILFRTIFELAWERTRKTTPEALCETIAPIEESVGLQRYVYLLPSNLKPKRMNKVDIANLRKSISRLIDGSKPYRLFERRGDKSVAMTYRAAMVALELFKKPRKSGKKNRHAVVQANRPESKKDKHNNSIAR